MDKFDTVKGFRTCTASVIHRNGSRAAKYRPRQPIYRLLSHRHSVPYSLLVDRYYRGSSPSPLTHLPACCPDIPVISVPLLVRLPPV